MVDDAYLNGYAQLCGANATLVYLCLCRHADRNQESFPSIELMSGKIGISRDSVMRGIKELVRWSIVRKERSRKKNQQWLNNTYFLLDKSEWKPKSQVAVSDMESQVANGGVAKSQMEHSQVAVSDTKDTQYQGNTVKKETHVAETSSAGKELKEFIGFFKEINPTYERLFENTTERAAAARLLAKFGAEKMFATMRALPKLLAKPYAPRISSPYQLEKKMGELIQFVKQEQAKNESGHGMINLKDYIPDKKLTKQ